MRAALKTDQAQPQTPPPPPIFVRPNHKKRRQTGHPKGLGVWLPQLRQPQLQARVALHRRLFPRGRPPRPRPKAPAPGRGKPRPKGRLRWSKGKGKPHHVKFYRELCLETGMQEFVQLLLFLQQLFVLSCIVATRTPMEHQVLHCAAAPHAMSALFRRANQHQGTKKRPTHVTVAAWSSINVRARAPKTSTTILKQCCYFF